MARVVTYLGNVEFEPTTADPVFSVDFTGLDSARMTYKGAAPKRKAFEDKQARFSPLAGYGLLYLMNWGSDEDPVFPAVELAYVGFRGSVSPVKIEDGKSVQTISVGVIPTSGDYEGVRLSVEAIYYASRTSYRWFETSSPAKSPRYQTVRNALNPFENFISWRVTSPDGPESVDIGTMIQLMNAMRPTVMVGDYQTEEIVPQKIWGCSSCVDYVLAPA